MIILLYFRFLVELYLFVISETGFKELILGRCIYISFCIHIFILFCHIRHVIVMYVLFSVQFYFSTCPLEFLFQESPSHVKQEALPCLQRFII